MKQSVKSKDTVRAACHLCEGVNVLQIASSPALAAVPRNDDDAFTPEAISPAVIANVFFVFARNGKYNGFEEVHVFTPDKAIPSTTTVIARNSDQASDEAISNNSVYIPAEIALLYFPRLPQG